MVPTTRAAPRPWGRHTDGEGPPAAGRFPFLAGALIPIANSSGILGLLAKLMPMTYSIDLARNIF